MLEFLVGVMVVIMFMMFLVLGVLYRATMETAEDLKAIRKKFDMARVISRVEGGYRQ